MERKKIQLIISGKPSYVNHMYNHLRKEHPSTRHKMHIEKNIPLGWGLHQVSSKKFGRDLKNKK